MYKDIITYKLAEGISEEHLLKVSKIIIDSWMSKLEGFIKWEIHTNNGGTYTDIVSWESKEVADNANKEMANIPNAHEWYACYKKGSISSENVNLIAEFE